ncbi:MAG: bile acid:sodium symporter family protein [Saprospiraceae bacterium]|nr:bile acid:sodium symporter family protein [Saprospiraceae bacterium]
MTQLDKIDINFDHNQVFLLNICLGILMFGVALDLKLSDFTYVFKKPKSVFAGLFSQWILLPVLTILLVYIIKPEYSLAMGMILIAACPGGNVSNYAVHISGANTPLSVVLTMISTILCAFTTPLIFAGLRYLTPMADGEFIDFNISFGSMILTIGQLIFIPLAVGFAMMYYFPVFTNKIKGFVRKLSMGIFIGFVLAAVAGNLENLRNYLGIVFFIVLLHNGLALAIGFYWSRIFMKLPDKDAVAISIETGIQNSGLALILIFNFFDGQGGMALIAAWWSIWHLLSSLAMALYWKRKNVSLISS